MKKVFWFLAALLVSILLTVASGRAADSVTLAWDPNSEIDLRDYRIYDSSTSGGHVFGPGHEVAIVLAGTETVTLTNLSDGWHFYVATATDTADNESGPSNEVSYSVNEMAPDVPQNLRIVAAVLVICGEVMLVLPV